MINVDEEAQIFDRYNGKVQVDVREEQIPVYLSVPVKLVTDLLCYFRSKEQEEIYMAPEIDPLLEEHGLPGNLDLTAILEEIFLHADGLGELIPAKIDEFEFKDGFLNIHLVAQRKYEFP